MILVLWLIGCDTDEETVCQTLCRELVTECGYGAYPTFESCQQGCGFQQGQGADVEGESACILKASCDTFAILECEHRFGPAE